MTQIQIYGMTKNHATTENRKKNSMEKGKITVIDSTMGISQSTDCGFFMSNIS